MNRTIEIKTAHYPIMLHANSGMALENFLAEKKYSSVFVLMDDNTYADCYPVLYQDAPSLSGAELLVIEPGEANKTIAIANELWQSLTEYGADRHSLLINLGGGLVTDLGGFVASVFKRGMDFVNIPTSLLAMVDASIGGKTGVNLDGYKNQLGLFSTPKLLLIDDRFLDTLAHRQLLSAYAEMLKHGLISSNTYWQDLRNIGEVSPAVLVGYIEKSIRIKKEVVESDPTEKGLRKILNFGHTIGHAIESYFMDKPEPLLHGEAVAIGMLAEARLSNTLGRFPKSELMQVEETIQKYFGYLSLQNENIEAILPFVLQDKKKEGDKLNLSLLNKIGDCRINVDVSQEQIKNALKQTLYGYFN